MTASMFGADDLPLFSGTPMHVEERPFVPTAQTALPAFVQPMLFADELPADQLNARLTSEGYEPGPPSPSAMRIDTAAVAQGPCRTCGGAREYRPFRAPGVTYRAFAVCVACNVAEEF